MEGIIIVIFMMLLASAIILPLFAMVVAFFLWVVGRIFGRVVSVIVGAGLILYLTYYAVSSHMSCMDFAACDSPGMLVFAPMIYIGIPAVSLVTAIVTRKVWVALEP
jgi:hypothetical protein